VDYSLQATIWGYQQWLLQTVEGTLSAELWSMLPSGGSLHTIISQS